MRPIPLAAPDGQIYAYACSHCRHVAGGSSSLMFPPKIDGPHRELVESSHRGATNCCICHSCGMLVELETWGIRCADCQRADEWMRMWGNLAIAISEGITTREAWARFYDFDDEIPGDDRSHDLPAAP